MNDPLKVIGELLAGRAKPVVNLARVVPSSVYDLQYRIAIISSAIALHAKPVATTLRIQSVRLKLLQFIASRPGLLQMVQKWSNAQHDAQLSMDLSQRLRRGFLADQMHDDVVAFLVARGELVHSGQYLILGSPAPLLTAVHEANVSLDLFSGEREVLTRLTKTRITNAMLEGW